MGPIELAGRPRYLLDVGDMLRSKFGDALPPAPAARKGPRRNRPQDRQRLYVWKGEAEITPASPSTPQPSAEMIDRLILPMSNVCVACLREGIVDNADVVDGAVIFGTGYAPFRGGPLNYARTRGVDNVVSTLRGLTEKFGGRFTPMPAGRISSERNPIHAPPNGKTEPRGDLCTPSRCRPTPTPTAILQRRPLKMDIGGGVFASRSRNHAP
jgi:hypothetical protein